MRQVLIALALGAAGCAGAEAMALGPPSTAAQQLDLGLHAGESMAFEVQLAGVLVGEAQLAVGDIGMVDGRKAVVVKSRAATAGAAALLKKISDEATTLIDAENGRPISVDTIVEMNGKRIEASAKFGATAANITYTRNAEKTPQSFKVEFAKETLHDAHTAMAQLRGWKAAPGTMRTVYVIGGRRLWRVDVKYAGEETIGSAVGNRRAVIFEGTSYRLKRDFKPESKKAARTFRVWLSDDADRVPLLVTAKTELGEIRMELVDYNRP